MIDTIQVSGPILPHHNYNLHHVVKATVKQQGQNGGYETEYTAERSTLGFNDLQQGETTSGTTNSSDTVNGWLSGNTFTYRQLAYRLGSIMRLRFSSLALIFIQTSNRQTREAKTPS